CFAASKRPSKRPLLSFSRRDHQLSALEPRRSKMADNLREMVAFIADQAPGVVDTEEIAAEREAFKHALAYWIEQTSIFDRAEPVRVFQFARCPLWRPSVTSGILVYQ